MNAHLLGDGKDMPVHEFLAALIADCAGTTTLCWIRGIKGSLIHSRPLQIVTPSFLSAVEGPKEPVEQQDRRYQPCRSLRR